MPAIKNEKSRTRLLCIAVNASMPELHKLQKQHTQNLKNKKKKLSHHEKKKKQKVARHCTQRNIPIITYLLSLPSPSEKVNTFV